MIYDLYGLTLDTTNGETAPASNSGAVDEEENRRRHDQYGQTG